MASRAEFRGVQSFSSVIESLERRFLKQAPINYEEEVDVAEKGDAAEGEIKSKKKKKSKKTKMTKEEEEWFREGEGFIDDSEINVEEEDVDGLYLEEPRAVSNVPSTALDTAGTAPASLTSVTPAPYDPSAFRAKFFAMRKERPTIEAHKGILVSESQSRNKFLAEHLDEWVPPVEVQHKLYALEQEIKRGFATAQDWAARRQKGLGRIEVQLIRVDRASRKVLPDGKRTPGYFAKLVHAFPPPFTRGQVVAHLQRALLTLALKNKERDRSTALAEAIEVIQRRLISGRGVKEPPPPNISSATLSEFDLSPLEDPFSTVSTIADENPTSNGTKAEEGVDSRALQCLEDLCDEVAARTLSTETLRSLLSVVSSWGERVRRIRPLAPPPHAFVAVRDLLETLLRTDKYFSWDGTTRSAMWKLGEACRACARARARLDAWVVEREADLILGGGKGPAKHYRPKPKTVLNYLEQAEATFSSRVFVASNLPSLSETELGALARSANLLRAMCECPSDYYFVDDQGDFVLPEKPVKATQQGSDAANTDASLVENGEASLLAKTEGEFEGDEKSGLANAIDQQSLQQQTEGGVSTTTTSTTPLAIAKEGEYRFAPSKGTRFQKVTWRIEDFQIGEFVSQDSQGALPGEDAPGEEGKKQKKKRKRAEGDDEKPKVKRPRAKKSPTAKITETTASSPVVSDSIAAPSAVSAPKVDVEEPVKPESNVPGQGANANANASI